MRPAMRWGNGLLGFAFLVGAALAAAPRVAAERAGGSEAEIPDYHPQVLRDPMQPYVEPRCDDCEDDRTPLERADLSAFRIVGLISRVRDAAAKVKLQGYFHTVKIGTKIGLNHGKVISIRGDEIVVREHFPQADGQAPLVKDMCMRMGKERTTVSECPAKKAVKKQN